MLDGVGHTRHVVIVREVANVHVHRGAGLVGIRVVHQKRLEAVRQADDTVRAVINGGLLELVRNTFDLPHGCRTWGVTCWLGDGRV